MSVVSACFIHSILSVIRCRNLHVFNKLFSAKLTLFFNQVKTIYEAFQIMLYKKRTSCVSCFSSTSVCIAGEFPCTCAAF